MKTFLMAVAALACIGSVALAGPNAGGVILVHNPNLPYAGQGDYCGQGGALASCEQANTELDGSDNSYWVWKIYAAFAPCSAPRLKAIAWGVHYDPWIIVLDHGPCIGDFNNGAFEQAGPGWPASDTGDAVLFQFTQTNILTEYYWFAGYAYYGQPGQFCLRDNPDPGYGGNFADDSSPLPLRDPIAGYGCLGFNQPGSVVCPPTNAEGACCVGEVCTMTCEGDCPGAWQGPNTVCDPNPCPIVHQGACCIGQVCYIYTQDQCLAQGGDYKGDGTDCSDPEICIGPIPVQIQTWGQIKNKYR